MSTSQGVNVLRYSALGLGIFYGFYHQMSLSSQAKKNQLQREYDHKVDLISKAKAEYAKKTKPAPATQTATADFDPNDNNFDLEAFIKAKMAESGESV